MHLNSDARITIDTIDQTEPHDSWKPRLADRESRRHLVNNIDFDNRVFLLEELDLDWSEADQRIRLESRERLLAKLAGEFGADLFDMKIENFKSLGKKPFSILARHNQFFDQARRAFIIGSYYPALVAACALGERILNHLILDLRNFYKNTPEYKDVYRKDSFDNWKIPIDTLSAWGVLQPKA
jgi:hypothetical protein